ncbi:CCA tRNA nucleotidyltransferase [Polymorphobacter arshaanensis]|uniref:CCA tRNA nucleotidyltransferase n=1 Tax=Glacieibacterium arshaanense TaxID=2511025 RepID=A0A4Y9ES47_9SPHN|nr:CCA tRNA nucleotidyltransferase [Polymorphobacter arshaanensis]TFU06445.1 CCA tRNA nucleotidyltransferase [Polymorphobacter arshaanensis]
MKLVAQPWMQLAGTRRVLAALPGARFVGGAVRDGLLGLPVTDVDVATQLPPQTVAERLAAAGIKVVPTGIAHGTVTAVTPEISIEITTLRRDVTTDGRRATVAFTDQWQEDAARRDFTINALYADPDTGEIDDYFGGMADLEARRVRFIGAPLERIAEDHLRILRFFRFHARFGIGAPDADGMAACTARANDLMALSRERIRDEVSKLLVVTDPTPTVALMVGAGILRPVLPEILPDGAARLAALVAVEPEPNWVRRLAALLPVDTALLTEIAYRLRLSNDERRRLVATATRFDAAEMWRFAWHDGAASAIDRLLLDAAIHPENVAHAATLANWQRPKMPATGRDLIARGVTVGPDVSRRLELFETAWIDAGFPLDSARVGELLDRASGGQA